MFAKIINAIKSFFANARVAVKAAKEERKTKKISEMSKENKKVYLTYLGVIFLASSIASYFVSFFFFSKIIPSVIAGKTLVALVWLVGQCVTTFVMTFSGCFVVDKFSSV